MPLLQSNFSPTLLFKNPHFNTIYRSLFKKEVFNYKRTRITTWDNDFIDLDFSLIKSKTLILLIHGLEGSSESGYMIATSKHLNLSGYDTVCMNLRGCSGEDNLLLKTYHSGKTDDVDFVINYLAEKHTHENIILCGFSLGGNLVLKYLGEYSTIHNKVKGAVTVSVPVDLTSSQAELSKFKNKLYLYRFLNTLKQKIIQKGKDFPAFKMNLKKVSNAKKFHDIEAQYTAPVFGFKSPEDYWSKASCKPYIPKIKLPTLLINAMDDTFLGEECYPFEEAKKSSDFYLMTPKYGGHVGFISSLTTKNHWMEDQIINFINKKINLN